MVFFTTQWKKGKEYVCVEERGRINGKVKRTFFKYLGPRELFGNLPTDKNGEFDPKQIETKSYEFGLSAALWDIAKEIDLPWLIDRIVQANDSPNLTSGEYITLAAINRVIDPGSKSYLATWFKKSWLSTKINIDPDILNAQTYWNLFQRVNSSHFMKVEQVLGEQLRSKYGLNWNQLLYDTSNFYSYAHITDENDLRQLGHSKEQRANLPIVNFYLICAKPWGIPLLHDTYAGKTQDAKEFKLIPEKIADHMQKLGYTPQQLTIYFDKGNLSPQAFAAIDTQKLKFVASLRNSMAKDLLHIPRSQFTKLFLPQSKKEVEFYRLSREVYNQDRIVYVLIDPAREKKHRLDFEKAFQKRYQKIQQFLADHLNIKMWDKEEYVWKKLTKMIGKKPWKEIILFKISEDSGKLNVSLSINEEAKQEHMETFGRSVLFTNQINWKPEDVIWAYREQYLIEHAFKTMKNKDIIALRPIFVSAQECIEGHVFICYLALLLLSILRMKLAKKGAHFSYDQITSDLSQIKVAHIRPDPLSDGFYKLEKIPSHLKKLLILLHLEQKI